MSIKVIEAGTNVANFDNMDTKREKVLFIDVENQATYDLTVYYTDEELADFDDASALKILLVDGQVMTLIPLK
jgi:hypothetical protein